MHASVYTSEGLLFICLHTLLQWYKTDSFRRTIKNIKRYLELFNDLPARAYDMIYLGIAHQKYNFYKISEDLNF